MVEKRRAKGAQKNMVEFTPVTSVITSVLHSYPDKIAITNLLGRGFDTQLKGGYKK
jgi:hypothetical protein